MKTAPAACLEQFGQIFQPSLGKVAPTRNNVAATCHVSSMCHEPARKRKTDADATRTNHLHVTMIFCGKLRALSSKSTSEAPSSTEIRELRVFRALHVKPCPRMPALRGRFIRGAGAMPADATGENSARNERPVRGDNRTGQAIWALGVDGRSRRIQPRWGGISAPTYIGRSKVGARSKDRAIFLTFCRGFFGPGESLRGGAIGSRRRRFVRRHGGRRLVQGPVGRTCCRPDTPPSTAGVGETAGNRHAGAAVMAETAAKASAAPAPN